MKRLYFAFFGLFPFFVNGQLFNQQFNIDMAVLNSGIAVSDTNYVSATPSNSQFTFLNTSSSGTNTMAVSSGALQIVTSSTSSLWGAVRNSNFSVTPTVVQVKMKAKIDVASTGSARKCFFYFGSGFTNSTAAEANTQIHSGFSIRYANSNYYFVKTLADGGGVATTDQVADNVDVVFTFVVNNSGATITYTAPNGTTESLGDDKWDLWLDNSKKFDEELATTNTQSLSQFKFGDNISSSAGRANWAIDYLEITNLTPAALPALIDDFYISTSNNLNTINWVTLNEQNMNHYVVEHSTNGIQFNTLSILQAKNNSIIKNSYKYSHAGSISSTNFYRLKAVELDGKFCYSNILKCSRSIDNTALIIAPNPVKNHLLQIQLTQLIADSYQLMIYDNFGKICYTKIILHQGDNASMFINLPGSLSSGIYNAKILSDKVTLSKQFILQN